MHKEFLDSRSSILESEKRQSNLHAPSQTASLFHIHASSLDNLPLSTKKLVTPPIISSRFECIEIIMKVIQRKMILPKSTFMSLL